MMPEQQTPPDDEPVVEPPVVADDEPPLSLDEYLDQRRDLETQLLALEARWRTRDVYPRWVYHATEAPRIVASQVEQDALEAGWEVRPVERGGARGADPITPPSLDPEQTP